MQRPPLFESDYFIYWKNRFETYVKAKDLDLWHIILNGDFPPVAKNEMTQILEEVPFEQQDVNLKKKLAKNNEAKMVLYNALPKKEYERVFMCKTAKDIWQSLLITHQEESIDSGFARFNTIIINLKALDEGFFSKNYVRKFLRALHHKWRAKVTTIEESKDLSSLALDELIGNLKVHEIVMEKDSEICRGKKERVKSIAMKANKEFSDDETSTSGSDDEEYAMAIRNFKKFFRRKVIQIISLAIVQNHLATKIKRPSLEVLGAIMKMTPRTKLTMKLVSWLNRQMSIEPATIAEALKYVDCVIAMHEELDQFTRLKVWRLITRPKGKTIINTKWIFKNKKDESILVIRNKARLVAQGYRQEEGINYDETFAPVARIEAIRLFLEYAASNDFTVFQMIVRMAILNGILKKEVYVGQPPGFVSKKYPNHVVIPPNGVPSDLVSGGVTSQNISSTKHKE
ncbi:DUF4219 domain-containing protein [Tanacetum coccineum]